MEVSYEGGQGPEGAVAPYMDGWMEVVFTSAILLSTLYMSEILCLS